MLGVNHTPRSPLEVLVVKSLGRRAMGGVNESLVTRTAKSKALTTIQVSPAESSIIIKENAMHTTS